MKDTMMTTCVVIAAKGKVRGIVPSLFPFKLKTEEEIPEGWERRIKINRGGRERAARIAAKKGWKKRGWGKARINPRCVFLNFNGCGAKSATVWNWKPAGCRRPIDLSVFSSNSRGGGGSFVLITFPR